MTEREPLRSGDLVDRVVNHGPYRAVVHTPATGSTNTDLVAAAQAGAPAWTAHVTDHQTAGRGRHGRPWQAPEYSQVTLSVLVKPGAAALGRLGTLPLAAGLAVVDAVRDTVAALAAGDPSIGYARTMTEDERQRYNDQLATARAHARRRPVPGDDCRVTGPEQGVYAADGLAADAGRYGILGRLVPRLKWPNDALVGGRKISGILAEAANLTDDPAVVVGLGLNVSLRPDELPVAHATSLDIAAAEQGLALEVDRTAVCAQVLLSLHRRLSQWACGDPALLGDYTRQSGTIGEKVTVYLPGDDTLTGTATAVLPDGRLVVTDDNGRPVEVTAGDVAHLRQA
ncbi:biotin--[acetyl-CoA-carboxylase] ligase [Corynebacterium mendelii]|uniref:biotin--[biotin carboxyl-carrier protein] ligase n=1 Tax=Corynebacterium mendelii TaxID=2765362 RepID=A0A939E127_9CORY|nr:biotin--[acetyl-CoA-carboxylase] ligase [Corynebacterium mendelii]MBN9644501.1 biotin--[acetyl-CoA-carboxylase] ligase [Corynebacterium mendelii]